MKKPVSLLRFYLMAAWLAFGYCAPAPAAALSCHGYAAENINFGNINLLDSTPVNRIAQISYGCDNGDQPTEVLLCISAGPSPVSLSYDPRYMQLVDTSQSGSLAYNLYQDAAATTILGSTGGAAAPLAFITTIVPYYDEGSITIYGRVAPFGQAGSPNGYYGAALPLKLSYMANETGANCSSPKLVLGQTWSLQVETFVTSQCHINQTSTLNFGTVPGLLTDNVDGASAISLTCTNALPYYVGLDNGQHADGAIRRMQGPNGYIQYELYRDSQRTQRWGNAGDNTDKAPGTGTGSSQAFTVYGRVMPQTFTSSGTFSDTIVVTVTY